MTQWLVISIKFYAIHAHLSCAQMSSHGGVRVDLFLMGTEFMNWTSKVQARAIIATSSNWYQMVLVWVGRCISKKGSGIHRLVEITSQQNNSNCLSWVAKHSNHLCGSEKIPTDMYVLKNIWGLRTPVKLLFTDYLWCEKIVGLEMSVKYNIKGVENQSTTLTLTDLCQVKKIRMNFHAIEEKRFKSQVKKNNVLRWRGRRCCISNWDCLVDVACRDFRCSTKRDSSDSKKNFIFFLFQKDRLTVRHNSSIDYSRMLSVSSSLSSSKLPY